MKLFIWGDTNYTQPYGADTLVVMANNLREARKLARSAVDFGFGRPNDERRDIDVSKDKPTMVIDKPDAVYCWWCE